jgi:hypothetical protein
MSTCWEFIYILWTLGIMFNYLYYYYYTLYYSVSGFRVHYEYASIVIETFVEAAKNVLAVHRTYLELWLTTDEHSCCTVLYLVCEPVCNPRSEYKLLSILY